MVVIAAELTDNTETGSKKTPLCREIWAHGHYSAMLASIRLNPDGGDRLVEQSLDVL